MSYLDLKEAECPNKDTERCPYCSFDPTSASDFCDKHSPDTDISEPYWAKQTDDTLKSESMSRNRAATKELIRRYKKKKEELKIYGDHIGSCPKRPCKCGFAAAWDSITEVPK